MKALETGKKILKGELESGTSGIFVIYISEGVAQIWQEKEIKGAAIENNGDWMTFSLEGIHARSVLLCGASN